MFEENFVKVFLQEESLALFPPLCKNTDLRYEECDCEECRPTQHGADSSICSGCGHIDGYHPEWCMVGE